MSVKLRKYTCDDTQLPGGRGEVGHLSILITKQLTLNDLGERKPHLQIVQSTEKLEPGFNIKKLKRLHLL